MIELWDCLKKLTDLPVQYKLLPLQIEKSHKETNGWQSWSSQWEQQEAHGEIPTKVMEAASKHTMGCISGSNQSWNTDYGHEEQPQVAHQEEEEDK